MSKVKYCVPAVKRDPLKGLILEYKALQKLSDRQLAEAMKVSRVTYSKRMNAMHTDQWLSDAKSLCKNLNVPIDEFRAAMRY